MTGVTGSKLSIAVGFFYERRAQRCYLSGCNLGVCTILIGITAVLHPLDVLFLVKCSPQLIEFFVMLCDVSE